MQASKQLVVIDKLTKTYDVAGNKVVALDSVSLKVPINARMAIMGPSGSGKSTLLQILGGLDNPTSGAVTVLGQSISIMDDDQLSDYRNQSIGFIFQSFNLLSHLTAIENVALPLILGGVMSQTANQQAEQYLTKVALYDKADKFPSQLSGGEMQRVAIARALIRQPAIILADEPTANLDKVNAENVLQLMLDLELQQQAIIIVTHDERIAQRFDSILEIDHGKVASLQVAGKPSNIPDSSEAI